MIKYMDIAKESNKLASMKVKILPILIGSFVTVTKGLLKGLKDLEIRGQAGTIQSITLLRTPRILRRFLEHYVSQSPVKDHQLTLMLKTLKEKKYVLRGLRRNSDL